MDWVDSPRNYKGLYWNLAQKTLPCIRLARGKFELTNQDSVGGKNSSVKLASRERHWNQATFFLPEMYLSVSATV